MLRARTRRARGCPRRNGLLGAGQRPHPHTIDESSRPPGPGRRGRPRLELGRGAPLPAESRAPALPRALQDPIHVRDQGRLAGDGRSERRRFLTLGSMCRLPPSRARRASALAKHRSLTSLDPLRMVHGQPQPPHQRNPPRRSRTGGHGTQVLGRQVNRCRWRTRPSKRRAMMPDCMRAIRKPSECHGKDDGN
jgi:hypothetical protein